MERDKKKALEALRSLASYQVNESGLGQRVEDKAKLKMDQLGISPEAAAKSAALMKIIGDASQGTFGQDFGNFDIKGGFKPKDKYLRVGWNKRF